MKSNDNDFAKPHKAVQPKKKRWDWDTRERINQLDILCSIKLLLMFLRIEHHQDILLNFIAFISNKNSTLDINSKLLFSDFKKKERKKNFFFIHIALQYGIKRKTDTYTTGPLRDPFRVRSIVHHRLSVLMTKFYCLLMLLYALKCA